MGPRSWPRWSGDGYRESTESWAELLRDLTDRGMRAPELMVGDGALGLWAALCTVWPQTRKQLCSVHKPAPVLSALPKRLNPDAKRLINGISYADSRTDALQAAKVLADALQAAKVLADELADHPKRSRRITRDLDVLTAFFDFPAEHHKHLRSTNPTESTFATVRLRTRVIRRAGPREAATATAYKLLDAAQQHWRRVDGPELVPLVRAGATFIDGQLVEREDTRTEKEHEDNDQERRLNARRHPQLLTMTPQTPPTRR